MRSHLRHLPVFLFYAVFFLSLFAQFPLNQSIPGNCDSWLVIALSNTYLSKLTAFFSGETIGRAMYPVENVLAYGESAPGSAAVFLFFKLWGLNDHVAYYGYITAIFTLTAFGVYLLCAQFIRATPPAVFAGFAFACSNVVFAHIDDSVVFFYFPAAICLCFLFSYFRHERKTHLYLAAVAGGMTIYFSAYVFAYQSVAVFVVLLFQISRRRNVRGNTLSGNLLKGAILHVSVALPFVAYYGYVLTAVDFVIPFEPAEVVSNLSLTLHDFFLILPFNPIYGGVATPEQGVHWMWIRHYAFTGGLFFSLVLVSLLRFNREKAMLLTIAAAGLLLAFGPAIQFAGLSLPSPLAYVYRAFPMFTYLRVVIRAYFLVVMVFSILAAWGLWMISQRPLLKKWRAGWVLVGLVMVIHFLENTPFPMQAYPVGRFVSLPPEYGIFANREKPAVVLDLPARLTMDYENWDETEFDRPDDHVRRDSGRSRLRVSGGFRMFLDSHENLFEYNREIIYMNWQTRHWQHIVGGINGYFPTPRVIFQKKVMDLPKPPALQWLKRNGVTHLAFHKDMVLHGESGLLNGLRASPLLEPIVEGERMVVFRMNDDLRGKVDP